MCPADHNGRSHTRRSVSEGIAVLILLGKLPAPVAALQLLQHVGDHGEEGVLDQQMVVDAEFFFICIFQQIEVAVHLFDVKRDGVYFQIGRIPLDGKRKVRIQHSPEFGGCFFQHIVQGKAGFARDQVPHRLFGEVSGFADHTLNIVFRADGALREQESPGHMEDFAGAVSKQEIAPQVTKSAQSKPRVKRVV